MSISSARTSVTDWPARASSSSPSNVEMAATCVIRDDGMTLTESPGRTVPLVINPENPRKSRFGRLTHCTGIRNALFVLVALDGDLLEVPEQCGTRSTKEFGKMPQ